MSPNRVDVVLDADVAGVLAWRASGFHTRRAGEGPLRGQSADV